MANNVFQGDSSVAIGGTDESLVVNPLSLVTSVKVLIDNTTSTTRAEQPVRLPAGQHRPRPDDFDIDLASDKKDYFISGFDTGTSGLQTVITVVGVDLWPPATSSWCPRWSEARRRRRRT